MDVACSEQWVAGPRTKLSIECVQLAEYAAHPDDGVDAEVRPRAVSRLAGDLDPEPVEALVRDCDLHFRRLCDDRCVGGAGLYQRLHADALVLLVANRGD